MLLWGMSQPVKLSDALVLDARIAGEAQERSIARQVEFWAKLGRSVELMLDGQQILTLCRTVGTTPLSDLAYSISSPTGRKRLKTYLDSEPFPHFEAHPSEPGLLVRTEENGMRSIGRFVNRTFISSRLEDGSDAGSISSNEDTAIAVEYRVVPDTDARANSTRQETEDSTVCVKGRRRSKSVRA